MVGGIKNNAKTETARRSGSWKCRALRAEVTEPMFGAEMTNRFSPFSFAQFFQTAWLQFPKSSPANSFLAETAEFSETPAVFDKNKRTGKAARRQRNATFYEPRNQVSEEMPFDPAKMVCGRRRCKFARIGFLSPCRAKQSALDGNRRP